ncbi:uncharacterized protein LOC125236519 [Leguminivora glycinivorella]|uniref:uncharacterized protein LOC125236519 n=1 Tax=Leguminivora glycinivorella TaxID=1035111 RepID=UPI00200D015E|nr:uncharacterized protein LOC125236519 [Leguminivora glycinivorella]
MAFYGKNYKKTKFENVDELLEAFKAPEKVRQLMKNTDSVSRFEKNADGTISYIVTKDGQESFNQKMTPGVEVDFTTPDGIQTKISSEVSDDAVRTVLTFPDGVKIHMDRVFEGNTMKNIMYKDGSDQKGIITYEQV